ncbi:hypothetical protein FIV42_08040 [Persicimonas caeni]|uniref:Uncharacterized protein n=1 Tax=Persicimonas caeni TaxID=2292766 RepID=A0A4Y6PR04_PERCE|nr:hypothetical protein [Persicimonas caeni]QDG50680.1 hypothetical protein FIV42_08040 [Persicimonas caeni]QED31901.1 hypothetical protein FRD00_08035 [Persicimonas caeni]
MGEANSTLVIELVVVCMTVAVGAVLLADRWPSPELPLMVMGGVAGIFLIYAVFAAVRDLRAMLRTRADDQEAPPAEQTQQPEPPRQAAQPQPQQPQPQPQQAAQPQAEPSSSSVETPALALGAPSEAATEFLSLDELRPETERDNTTSQLPSVPLFAESSMYSTAELAAGAREISEQEEAEEAKTEALPAVEVAAVEEASEARTEALPAVEVAAVEDDGHEDESEAMTEVLADLDFDFDSIKLEDS